MAKAQNAAATFHIINDERDTTWDKFEAVLVLLPAEKNPKSALAQSTLSATVKDLPAELAEPLLKAIQRFEFIPTAGNALSLPLEPFRRVTLAVAPRGTDTFTWLEWGRGLHRKAGGGGQTILCLARALGENAPLAVDALLAASRAAEAVLPRYSAKKAPAKKRLTWTFLTEEGAREKSIAAAAAATLTAEANNLVRELAMQAGNDLTPKVYVAKASALAMQHGLKSEFFNQDKLKKMKAGAFLAVAQGNDHSDSGILKIIYTPKKKGSSHHIALVGKGLTFDTGGQNLKTGNFMFGMHEDMTGSALALALVCLASKEEWPFAVTSYLAITENVLSPASYRPNDVITALNGKTIEVVDTDAEGRMVLADTLTLASEDKPTLIMDFATLTGSCIRALGTFYSGAYTNRPRLHSLLRKSGKRSGERVWPFPLDPAYARVIKSSIADIKQCFLSGGVDHIAASYFLSQFVGKKLPWVHIDLSAAHNEGGLGAVGTKTTGFGVRFAREFLFRYCE